MYGWLYERLSHDSHVVNDRRFDLLVFCRLQSYRRQVKTRGPRRRRNLIPASNVCETAPRSLFRTLMNLAISRKCVSTFPSNWLVNRTMAFSTDHSWRVLKSWYTAGVVCGSHALRSNYTLLDLHNSSNHTRVKFIIANYYIFYSLSVNLLWTSRL